MVKKEESRPEVIADECSEAEILPAEPAIKDLKLGFTFDENNEAFGFYLPEDVRAMERRINELI